MAQVRKQLHMDVELLEALVAFGRAGNVVDAARLLKISQPALSVRLARLDMLLDGQVFEMKGKRKVMTALGRRLFEELHPAWGRLQAAWVNVLRSWKSGDEFPLRFAGRREILARLSSAWSYNGPLLFRSMGSAEARESLLRGESDVAVTRYPVTGDPDFQSEVLFHSAFVFLCPSAFWRSRSSPLDGGQQSKRLGLGSEAVARFWATVPLATYTAEDPFIFKVENHLDVTLAGPRLVFDDWRVVLSKVLEEKWAAFVPLDLAGEQQHETRMRVVRRYELPAEIQENSVFYLCYAKSLDGFLRQAGILNS